MKLKTPTPDPAREAARLRDLRFLLEQPTHEMLRPCGECALPCPCSQSKTCTCRCAPTCESAPIVMSSDGDRYAIEGRIVDLVFYFNSLRVCPPYWSCEGHELAGGEIFRVPQVWFYSYSLIYPRLVSEYVFDLYAARAIENPWHVCVSYAESALETGFSLEPDVKMIANLKLSSLQHDVKIISDRLVPGVRALAARHLEKYAQTHSD